MSADLATLAIRVDSSGVVTASKDLDELAGRSKKVETATQSMNSGFQTLKTSWIAASVAIAAAWMAVSKAMEYATLGAKALQAEESFRMVAKASNENANQILADMKRVSAGTIDDSALMQKAVKGMALGLSGNEMVNILAAARLAARLTGEDIETAYGKITDAIATNMPRGLRQYGLITKEQLTVVNQAIAAGVPNINLYGLAMANSAEQLKKFTIEDRNVIEQIQKGHAEWQEATEKVGKFIDKIIILWGKVGDLNKELNAHPPSLISWFGSLGAKADISPAPTAQKYVVPDIVQTPEQIMDEMKAATRLVQQRKSALEAMQALDKSYFAQREAMIKNTEEVSVVNGTNEYAAKQKTIDDMRALDATYLSKTMSEIKAEDDTRTQTEKDILSSEIFIHDKKIALYAEVATRLKQLDLDEILNNANKNIAILTSENAAYMAINQYSEESVNLQIKEIDRLAKAQIIKSGNGVVGNEVAIAAQTEDAKVKLHAAANNAIATQDLAMYSVINKYSIDSQTEQEKIWTEAAAKYVRESQDKVKAAATAEEWLKTQINQFNQDKLNDAANYYSTIVGYEDTYRQKKFEWIDKEQKRLAAFYKDDAAAAKWAADEKKKFDTEVTLTNVQNISKGLGSMVSTFETLSQMYAEDSSQRKTLHDVSMGMAVLEKAAMVGEAYVAGTLAVLKAGTSGPYVQFAAMAAMAAAVAVLLAQIGVAFSGGSGASAPAAKPASTVLGAEAGTGSESIANSMKLMEDTYKMEDTKLTAIYDALKDLNSSIIGLVTSIVRTGGITTGTNLNITNDEIMANLTGVQTVFKNTLTHYFQVMFSAVGDWISVFGSNKLVENFIGAIFGGGIERSINAQGIEIGATVIKNLLAGIDVSAQAYAHVQEIHKGGWFSSDWESGYTVYGALDKNITTMLTLVFKNIGTTLVEVAKGLGTDVQAVYGYVFETTTLNLQNMTSEEMSKALNEYFNSIADKATETLFGSILLQYQKLDEGLLETAVRLVTDKAVIMQYLELVNQKFNGTIPAAIKFSETLITIAGGLDKLTEAMQTYYDAFFSDSEKQAKLKEQMTAVLGQYGFALPDQRAGYRSLVESLNLTTDAGQTAYVALMQMSKGADEYYKYLEQAKGNIKPESYATAAEYQRALRGFAEGGISSGPESGYEARLHGTELIISPRKGYPVSVNNDNVILIEELRALRAEMKAGNKQVSDNTLKTAKILDKVDNIGWPAERTA